MDVHIYMQLQIMNVHGRSEVPLFQIRNVWVHFLLAILVRLLEITLFVLEGRLNTVIGLPSARDDVLM